MIDDPPLHILVVENHPDTLFYLEMFLEEDGHTVESAITMREGLRRLEAGPVDLLICDIGLPDGTGWELLERLGPNRPPCAVAMSGFGSHHDTQRSQQAGFFRHLNKPFELHELRSALHEARRRKAGS